MKAQDLAEFQSSGFLVLPAQVGAADLRALCAEAQRILDGLLLSDERVTAWRLASGKAYVLKIKSVVALSPAVREAADLMGRVASVLLGGPVTLIDDKISFKQRVPGTAPARTLGEEVHKHTDAAYYRRRGLTGDIVTLAVCLDDCAEASGPVRVWPGSHLHEAPEETTVDHGPVIPDAAAPDHEGVALTAKAGDVLAWDARLVHASGPNTSGRPRRLLILGFAR
ncbi:phytanoyl-CoA dioxygenase family protein [Actinocorallia aurea]